MFVYVKNSLSSKDALRLSSFHTKIIAKTLEKIANYSAEGENGAHLRRAGFLTRVNKGNLHALHLAWRKSGESMTSVN